jgi:hypoxanthine phosphoribosyltransferase
MGQLPAELARVILTEEELRVIVARLAKELARDYGDKSPVFVVTLKGAFIFAADLTRQLDFPFTLEFVRTSSYSGDHSTGKVKLEYADNLKDRLKSRHVVIIEDILDTGLTLRALLAALAQFETASLEVCTLLTKPSRLQIPIQPRYTGQEMPDEFLVGYGLDWNEQFRCLPYIASVNPRAVSQD